MIGVEGDEKLFRERSGSLNTGCSGISAPSSIHGDHREGAWYVFLYICEQRYQLSVPRLPLQRTTNRAAWNSRYSLSLGSGDRKSEIKVWAAPRFRWNLQGRILPCLALASFDLPASLRVPWLIAAALASLPPSSALSSLCVPSSSPLTRTSVIRLGIHQPPDLFLTNSICSDPVSKYGTFWGTRV